MADRTVLLAQNGRHALRGLTLVNPQEFSAYQEDDDDLTYIVDMSNYLDGSTISAVTRNASGVVVSNTSNTTTRLSQRLKGFGRVDFKVTTSGGDIEEFRITIQPRGNNAFFLTNTASVPQNTAQFFATVAEAEATNPANTVNYIWTSGNGGPADGYGGLWKYVATAPSHDQYFQTASGRYYQRAAWGGDDAVRGAFTDTPTSWPDGANIWRFTDRVFLGDAVGSAGASTASGGATFANDAPLSSFYLERSATLLSASPWGGIGGSFLTKSSLRYSYLGYSVWAASQAVTAGAKRGYGGRLYTATTAGTTGSTPLTHTTGTASDGVVTWRFDDYSYQVPIGMAAAAISDSDDGTGVWAGYFQVSRALGGGTSYGLEVVAQNDGADVIIDSYGSTAGATIGIWFAGGGDATLNPSLNNSSAAMMIGPNDKTWNAGIVFRSDAITLDGGSRGPALEMAQGHMLVWRRAAGSIGARIWSSVSTISQDVAIEFANNTTRFIGPGGNIIGQVEAVASAANYIRLISQTAGNMPEVRAGGSDTNVDLTLTPRGAGNIRFGTHSAIAAETLTGYITIKDAGGTTRKIAVVS